MMNRRAIHARRRMFGRSPVCVARRFPARNSRERRKRKEIIKERSLRGTRESSRLKNPCYGYAAAGLSIIGRNIPSLLEHGTVIMVDYVEPRNGDYTYGAVHERVIMITLNSCSPAVCPDAFPDMFINKWRWPSASKTERARALGGTLHDDAKSLQNSFALEIQFNFSFHSVPSDDEEAPPRDKIRAHFEFRACILSIFFSFIPKYHHT